MGQGEDGAHSDRPASSSAGVPSQRLTSSSERDGEEEDGLAYDRDSQSLGEEGGFGGDGKHREEDMSISKSALEASVDVNKTSYDEQAMSPIQRSVSTGGVSNAGGATRLSRAESQWRIPRVPPPSVDADTINIQRPSKHEVQSLYNTGAGAQEDEDMRTDESAEERARNAAAAREVSREMDALAFGAIAPPSTSSGYATPKAPPPGYGSSFSVQSQAAAPYLPSSSPPQHSSGRTPASSAPSSPILPPNPPFANRGRGMPAMMDTRHPGHTSSESISGRIPAPTPIITTSVLADGGGVPSPTAPRSTSPMYRSPPLEYPRLTPPFSSPLMASSTSSLNGGGGASPGGPRTISAAAFRRQQVRSPSAMESGPADTSPLTLRKPSVSSAPAPAPVSKDAPKAKLSVANPDPRVSEEGEGEGEEFDYIKAYGENSSEGYGAGRYVSDLEKH